MLFSSSTSRSRTTSSSKSTLDLPVVAGRWRLALGMMLVSFVKGFLVPARTFCRSSCTTTVPASTFADVVVTVGQFQSRRRFVGAPTATIGRLFSTKDASDIEQKIKTKGDEIRQMKTDGIDKATLTPHVEELLSLKAQLEQHQQQQQQQQQGSNGVMDQDDSLEQQVKAKGDEIRKLKENGIDKAALAPHIEELMALKAQLPDGKEPRPAAKNDKQTPQQGKKSPAANAASKNPEEMSEKELRYTRLAKVEAMREAGVEPYEYSYDPTHKSTELAAMYEGRLEGGEEDESANVAVAGRIMTRRVFGKLAFFTLQDETGTIQLQFDTKRLGDTFKVSWNRQFLVLSCVTD